jgi:hypothetical protein
MAIEYTKKLAIFKDVVSVEDAEVLLEWLQNKSSARVDLSACTHLHPANLQVLMVAKPVVSAWPEDVAFTAWLKSALVSGVSQALTKK